jgi:hypothetical protein
VLGVGFVVVIVCVIVFLCKKCARRTRQTAGATHDTPPSDDNPGADPHYDVGMQQRMDEWAAIRRRRPAKPFDKPGNNPEAGFAPQPGKICFIIQSIPSILSITRLV